MKSVIWRGLNTLDYTDVPEPTCPDGWVKIKVMSVGLCATDVHIITGAFDAGDPPHTLGHEICGDIVECGKGANTALIGKRAVVETYVGCGKCEYCQKGQKHLCSAGEIGYPPYNGGEAQYVVVPEGCVRLIPDCISYDEGAIMEAVACPFGAVITSGFEMGQTMLVQGAGIAGLSFIQAARAAGAGRVFCTVRNDIKAALVRHFGGEVIDLREHDMVEYIMKETNGRGVDVSVDAIGNSAAVAKCFETVAAGGRVLLYGIPDKNDTITMPATDMILRQITVCGYTGNQFGWDKLIRQIELGNISIKEFVTRTYPLSKINDALAFFMEKHSDTLKIVLHPWEE